MWLIILSLSASAMTLDEAVDAAAERSPALEMSDARVDEAQGRLSEVNGRLMPSAALTANLLAQTAIEVDLSEKIPLPPTMEIDPLQVMPGAQVQGGFQVTQPLIAPPAWAGRTSARHGVDFAKTQVDADRRALELRVAEVFHRSAEAHALLDDATRAEELAARLLERGTKLADLGAVATHQVLPFKRAHATARANVAQARAGAQSVDGVLQMLTGLPGHAEATPVPTEAPDLAGLLTGVDRADLRAAEQGAKAAASTVSLQRAGMYPTVGLQAAVMAVSPAPDFGEDLTWRVGIGANIPIFQGGVVASKVRQAQAKAAQADAGVRASRERAELEIRQAHGALTMSLAALDAQREAVSLAEQSVTAAETLLTEGGGSMLQLQQAQMELIAAQAALTRATAQASRASDALRLASGG